MIDLSYFAVFFNSETEIPCRKGWEPFDFSFRARVQKWFQMDCVGLVTKQLQLG